MSRMQWLVWAACAGGLLGCAREAPPEFVLSAQTQELDAALIERVEQVLTEQCGTPLAPKMLGREDFDLRRLAHGAAVYTQRCATCHGASGDGAGPVAAYLYPRPRDYRRGIFKFVSTGNGVRPLRSDLERTIKQGATGTSMPSFALLPEEDLQPVIDYVLALTHRGEFEIELYLYALDNDEIDDEGIPDLIANVQGNWEGLEQEVVAPLTVEPPRTLETIALGREAFLTELAGCYKCHGPDGTGRTSENQKGFNDLWEFQTRAADLTSGMYHGGGESLDIYRRIYAGVNGSPMPSFKDKLQDQPETIWHLVHYVQWVAAARHRSVQREMVALQPAPGAPQVQAPPDELPPPEPPADAAPEPDAAPAEEPNAAAPSAAGR